MKKVLLAAAAAATMATLGTATVSAHPDNGVKAPNECDPIDAWTWGKVRKGMSLDAVEQLLGCHGSHHQTVPMKSGDIESYFFRTGSKNLVRVTFKHGKLFEKYGYYSGL